MGDVDIDRLWERLERCGRFPTARVDPASQEVVLRAWLGDYDGAIRRCADDKLRGALVHLISYMPTAEKKSEAFFDMKVPLPAYCFAAPDIVVKRGCYNASDGTEIGYTSIAPTPESLEAAAIDHGAPLPEPALLVRWGGNAEVAILFEDSQFCAFVRCGLIRAMFVDYRGYGWSNGVPSVATLRHDAEDFFNALPTVLPSHGIAWPLAGPLVAMGRSIGAHCALHLAVLHPKQVHALVLDSPASCHWPMEHIPCKLWAALLTELPRLQAAERTLRFCQCCRAGAAALCDRMAAWLDPVDIARCLDMPLLLLNGTADTCCPEPQTGSLFQAFAGEDKAVIWIRGASHNDVSCYSQYWVALGRFLERTRGGGGCPGSGGGGGEGELAELAAAANED